MKNLDKMTTEELTAHKLQLHEQEDAVRAQLVAAEGALAAKLTAERVDAAIRAAVGEDWGGSVTISPPPAIVAALPGEVS